MATETPQNVVTGPARGVHRLTDSRVLFPLLAVILLVTIWTVAALLIRSDYVTARRAAATSTVDLALTYEAQVVRALREIDQTLKFIKYAYADGGDASVLSELDAQGLLPSDLLFVVSIADGQGNIIATTGMSKDTGIANEDYFQAQRDAETFAVGTPQQDPENGEWAVHFSRRLEAPDGSFAGIVIVSSNPAYFVSSYERATMGRNGVLGVLGTDGVFRARRTGDAVSYGDTVDYAAVVVENAEHDAGAEVSINEWDGVPRYTIARELYGFPLAVIVALSEQEQLAAADALLSGHFWRAGIASALAILVLALLGRLNWQLQQSRLRAMEEQVAHAKQVEHLAYHDSLTGLPNRSLFSKLLNLSISQASRYQRRLAVLFLDLDRFKLINDTLGHHAGDELLIQVAERLKSSLRNSDTVARLGGDEFVVLLPEMNEEKQLTIVATKILAAVRSPFVLAGQELRVTVSIGISNYPQDGEDEQTLMKNADIAMYNAKEEGKNNFRFYSAELNANSLERLSLESNLRRALENNEFRLVYQARKSINSNRITGVEALLRWQHPDLGLIAPLQFLPMAEESGLIVPIGKWVLETACRQSVAWKEQGLAPLNMAVNLSAREFADEHLLQSTTAIIGKTGMDPRLLEIEFAESMLMRDLDKAVPVLDGLTSLGVRIAIDDFGAGYASLSALRKFHVNTIKVDNRFIRDIVSNAEDRNLVEAIIAMAKVLGLTVVAEGVETQEQADFLGRKSCDEIQGFYFSRPLPADSLTSLLESYEQ